MTSVLSRMTSPATCTHTHTHWRHARTHAPSCCLSPSHTQTTGIPENLYLKQALGMFFLFSAFRHSIKSGQCRYSGVERERLSDDKHWYDKIQSQQWVNNFFFIKIMKAHSAEEHESAIMKCLSQTRIVTNLLRLQNTTFQTCSFSKYSPIIPRLIFKASLFSLSPPTTNPRTSSTRERERERDRGDEGSI